MSDKAVRWLWTRIRSEKKVGQGREDFHIVC